jgi:hypothetical protein
MLHTREARLRLKPRYDELDDELTTIQREQSAEGRSNLLRLVRQGIEKIDRSTNLSELGEWAVSNREGNQWALQALARLDGSRYATALETRINTSDGKWAGQFFAALVKADRARAVSFAKTLRTDASRSLVVAAFRLLSEENAIPGEAARVSELLRMIQGSKTEWKDAWDAIEALVPEAQPLRYPGPEIDKALLKILDFMPANSESNNVFQPACRALAIRGRTAAFDQIVSATLIQKDPMLAAGALGPLVQLAQADPEHLNAKLESFLTPHLKTTSLHVTDLLWAIWAADLRGLKPEIERLATSSPDEYEDKRSDTWGGTIQPIEGRFHLARKIASLWNEEDPDTKVRLMFAFLLQDGASFVGGASPERTNRMRDDLRSGVAKLSPMRKAALSRFLADAEQSLSNQKDALEIRQKAFVFAHSVLSP